MLDTLSAAELQDWVEFYALEPWGSEAAFLRSGIVASIIANTNRDSKRKPEPFTPRDFMPDFSSKRRRVKPGLDPKHVRAMLKSTFAGRIKHRGPKILDNRGEGDPNSTPGDIGRDDDDRK